jgi:hypothetical protein
VFHLEWPPDIKEAVRQTNSKRKGYLTNSDLELAGLLLIWYIMEAVCDLNPGCHMALFSDNLPTVKWMRRLAAKGSKVAGHLLRALALRLKICRVSPLTPLHIAGAHNAMTDIPSRSFGSVTKWHCPTNADLLTLFNNSFPLPGQTSWTVFQVCSSISMRVISALRMKVLSMDKWAATALARVTHWKNWEAFVQPLGVDPFLQGTDFTLRTRCLTGFAAHIRRGGYRRGRQVKSAMVSTALMAVGTEIALACGNNPTKLNGSDRLLPRLSQMLEGWHKTDDPVMTKLPVEADVPEYLMTVGLQALATPLNHAVGDLALIAYYYLLCIGEYTGKASRQNTKQTQQFEMRDVTFFHRDNKGHLRQLLRDADNSLILFADSATLKLDNQKNSWKGVCINHEWNGMTFLMPSVHSAGVTPTSVLTWGVTGTHSSPPLTQAQ